MARDYSRRNVDIWGDPDMRALPFPAQYLYNVLWDHPKLSYCGALDWRPGKIAQLADGLTPALVREFAACLQARYFLVVDEDTEEALLRSWVRFDGLMKQPRLAVSFVSAYAELGSNNLRAVVVDELAKLKDREPELAGFKDKRVLDILGFSRTSARDLPTPSDPFGDGFAFTLGEGLAQTVLEVSVPPTPSPSPAPAPEKISSPASKTGKPKTAMPEGWKPHAKHEEKVKSLGLDLNFLAEQFADWHGAKGTLFADWDLAFFTWIRNAPTYGGNQQPRLRVVNDGRPEGW